MLQLAIGQFSLCVSGENKLVELLPPYWNNYKQTEPSFTNEIVLSFSEGICCYENVLHDGWFKLDHEGNHVAYYVVRGKAVLEFQYYYTTRRVTVCISNFLDSYVRLGAHYGLMIALYQKCIGLHGVTVLCGKEIVILSAPSGTGKTTLSRLLERYCDAVTINGDFALLSLTDNEVMFEPTPFCGTSRRCLNHRFRVDRIVFLGQAKTNQWQSLTGRQALIYFLNNCFVPSWDSKLEKAVQDNIMRCISCVKVNAYSFAPTKDAAEEFYKQLE